MKTALIARNAGVRNTSGSSQNSRAYGVAKGGLKTFRGEFWTARQRQMHPVHYTVSYRASFKPELPEFFIRKFCSSTDELVLDPFGGRGTTVLQANLMGYSGIYNDINPVSHFISHSRRTIPELPLLIERVNGLNLSRWKFKLDSNESSRLLPFFHHDTLQEILNLRKILTADSDKNDHVLQYLGVTALSRLYGHSDGFFSVYTFPQISIMPGAQRRNNINRGVKPEYRNVQERIIRKLRRDLSQELPEHYHLASQKNSYLNGDARSLNGVASNSVSLVVTSPPFLDKVNYVDDNWLRAWFLNMEEEMRTSEVMMTPDTREWTGFMRDVIRELGRVLKIDGRIVIEVGEVKSGRRLENLEELLIEQLPLEVEGGLLVGEELYLNEQSFTKLSNCWDIKNNKLGTNTNRCLVIKKKAKKNLKR